MAARRVSFDSRGDCPMRIMYDLPDVHVELLAQNGINWRELPFACLSMLALTSGALALFLARLNYGLG